MPRSSTLLHLTQIIPILVVFIFITAMSSYAISHPTLLQIPQMLGGQGIEGATEEQRIAYRYTFSRLDQDGDEKLSLKEYQSGRMYSTPMTHNTLFSASDLDKNNFMTEREYIFNRVITDEALLIFQVLDRDGNGHLVLPELLRTTGYTEEIGAGVFALLDHNQDDAISISEVLQVWYIWAQQYDMAQL